MNDRLVPGVRVRIVRGPSSSDMIGYQGIVLQIGVKDVHPVCLVFMDRWDFGSPLWLFADQVEVVYE